MYKTEKLRSLQQYLTIIGVGRFRILGWARIRILGRGCKEGGGANSQMAHDVVLTSMRRNDVTSTSFRRYVPKSVPNNYILILKSDYIENSRVELKGIDLPVPSNQIKVTFVIILPFNLLHL